MLRGRGGGPVDHLVVQDPGLDVLLVGGQLVDLGDLVLDLGLDVLDLLGGARLVDLGLGALGALDVLLAGGQLVLDIVVGLDVLRVVVATEAECPL